MIKSLVLTLVAFLFSTLLVAQKVGDSIQIISYSNRTYNGQVYKIDIDGYFIKGNYGTIFLNKSENPLLIFLTENPFESKRRNRPPPITKISITHSKGAIN